MIRLLTLVLVAACVLPALPPAADAASAKNLRIESLTCSAVPNELGWSKDLSMTFVWSARAKGAVRGFSYTLAVGRVVEPDATIETRASSVTFTRDSMPPVEGPGDWWYGIAGDFHFSVVACGAKGRMGIPLTIEVKNDPYPLIFWREELTFNGQPETDLIDHCFNVAVEVGDPGGFINPTALFWYRELSVDGATWTRDMIVPAPADHSNDGRHDLEYRVWSQAGVPTIIQGWLVIDTVAPVSRVMPDDSLWHNGADYAYDLIETNPWDHWASLDGGEPQPFWGSWDLPWELGDGLHEVTLWGTDAAGNVEPEHTVQIKVDNRLEPAAE